MIYVIAAVVLVILVAALGLVMWRRKAASDYGNQSTAAK